MIEKVKDIIKEKPFFENFKKQLPEDYQEIFGNTNPAHLDRSLSIKGGGRYASPLFKEYLIEEVVIYITTNNLDKWKKYKELLNLDYNILNPYEQKKTTVQEKTGENISSTTENETSKVHTFDSENAIDKNIESTENTDKLTESENVKITVETSGNVGNVAPTKLIIEEMNMRATQLNDLILKDVLKEISLDIYE